jgi:hypothetical protein
MGVIYTCLRWTVLHIALRHFFSKRNAVGKNDSKHSTSNTMFHRQRGSKQRQLSPSDMQVVLFHSVVLYIPLNDNAPRQSILHLSYPYSPLRTLHFLPFLLLLLVLLPSGRVTSSTSSSSSSISSLSSAPTIRLPPSVSLLSSSIALPRLPLNLLSLALRSASQPLTNPTTSSCGFSSPFQAWQLLQRQRPTSSSDRAPGGAWPLTRRHSEQMRASRFLD